MYEQRCLNIVEDWDFIREAEEPKFGSRRTKNSFQHCDYSQTFFMSFGRKGSELRPFNSKYSKHLLVKIASQPRKSIRLTLKTRSQCRNHGNFLTMFHLCIYETSKFCRNENPSLVVTKMENWIPVRKFKENIATTISSCHAFLWCGRYEGRAFENGFSPKRSRR